MRPVRETFIKTISKFVILVGALVAAAPGAHAKDICTLVADAATGAVIHETGTCDLRVTPASTFKVPIAVMGFDAGVLTGQHAPVWSFREGYPDWVAAWKQDTDPTAWMRESVLWYSQEITRALGEERFAAYVSAFGYGNEDVRGNTGKNDGLTRAWLSSSLKISPREQVTFLRKLISGGLPVRAEAQRLTTDIMPEFAAGDWTVRGKMGSARTGDKSIGWFVGWASDGSRTVVFARQADLARSAVMTAGRNTRDGLLGDLPQLLRAQ